MLWDECVCEVKDDSTLESRLFAPAHGANNRTTVLPGKKLSKQSFVVSDAGLLVPGSRGLTAAVLGLCWLHACKSELLAGMVNAVTHVTVS